MITALVPIKTESERLPNKNFLDFCGKPLYQIILDKLEQVEEISQIIINTDSEIISNEVSSLFKKVIIHARPSHLLGNEITMNEIIEYDLSILNGEHFLQTHCTNPLLKVETMQDAISNYFTKLELNDSLLSVESIKKRVYRNNGDPINHSNEILLQTQHLPEVYIENSNLFLFSRTSFFKANKSRVGLTPQFLSMSFIEGIDIDYANDFIIAELIEKNQSLFSVEGIGSH